MIRGYGPKKPVKQKRRELRKEIPFQRVKVEIQLQATQEVIDGRVFLNDLTSSGVGCFVNDALDKGEKVALVIEHPKPLFIKGEVAWCSPYTLDTKVLSSETFHFRVGIKFIFESQDEAETVKKYCEEIFAEKSE